MDELEYQEYQDENGRSAGMYCIQDILNTNGHIASQEFLETKFNCRFKGLQYQGLIDAIPKVWKKMVVADNQSIHFIVRKKCELMIDGIWKDLEETNTRDVYWVVIKSVRPKSENKWISKSNINFSSEDWKHIYLLPYKLTENTRLITFQLKITHRILACNEKLQTWKINKSSMCSFCAHTDTLEHFIYDCKNTSDFWEYIYRWWYANTKIGIP